MDQNAELPLTPINSWSLPQYDIIVNVASTRVQWAIYGLQLTVKIISGTPVAFQPCEGRFFWQRSYQGRINFMRRGTGPTSLLGAHQATKSDAPDLKTFFNKSLAGGAGADEGLNAILWTADPDISTIADNNSNSELTNLHSPQLQVVPTYNGLPMTSNSIFAIALAKMVLGAEKGPQQACTGIRDGSFDMVPILDTQGQSLLKFHSLIKGHEGTD